MGAEGVQQEQTLRQAGYGDSEIAQWKSDTAGQLQGAGFSPSEVSDYFGAPGGQGTDLTPHIHGGLKAHLDERTPEGGGPAKATTFADAFMAGIEGSSGGLVARRKLPDVQLPPDAELGMKIAAASGSLVGDIPAMVAGGLFGAAAGGVAGSPVPIVGNVTAAGLGAGAGAFALPAALRRAYVDDLQKGSIKDFPDFFARAAGVAYDGIKGGITGAVTAATGGIAGPALEGLGATATTAALGQTAAELATMTTVGKGLEGQVPKPEDFLIGAVTLAGFHGVMSGGRALGIVPDVPPEVKAVETKLQNTYAETGAHPNTVLEAAAQDPVLKQQLLSKGTDTPPLLAPSNPEFKPVDPNSEMGQPHPTLNEKDFGSDNPTKMAPPPEPPAPTPPKEPPAGSPPLSDRDAILARIGEQGEAKQPKWDGFYTQTVDRLNPIYQWAKEVTGGEKLPANEDPYAVMSTALSRGFARADEALNDGPVDFAGNKIEGVKSLKEILAPFKEDPGGFKAYLLARHSLSLEAREIETSIPQEQARRYVEQNSGKYEAATKELVKFQNTGPDYLQKAGFLTKEQVQTMKDENPFYIPMRRVLEEGPSTGPGGTNPIKAIRGSDKQVIDPLESIIKNQFAYYKIAEQNRGKQAVVDLAREYDAPPELLEKMPGVSKPITATDEEVAKWMEKNGIEGSTPGDFTLWRGISMPLQEGEFAVMEKGERKVYSVDPSLAKSLSATAYSDPNILLKAASVVATVQRVAVTENPWFLLKHAVRDQFAASIYSQNGYRFGWDGMRAMFHLVMDTEKADEFFRNGGGMSTIADFDKNYVQKDVWGLSKETGLLDKTVNVIKTPFELYHEFAKMVFTAPKMGEFLRAMDKGKDAQTAAWEGRRVTPDIGAIGASDFVRGMSAATPFFSMRIRGIDQMASAIKEDPIGYGTKVALHIAIPSLLTWLAFKDDERYKNAPNWVKDLGWVIPSGDTVSVIPKPFEPGLIFGSLLERTLTEAYEKDPSSFKLSDPNFLRTLIGSALPNVVPPVLMPALEQMANRSWLTGGNIVPHKLEGVAPAFQYNQYTTETGKMLAKFISYVPGSSMLGHGNVTIQSPMVVENYVRGWTGNVGMYALHMVDKALEASGVNPATVAPKSDNWVKNLADTPFVKSFFMRFPSGSAQPLQDFYDNFEKAKTRSNTLNELKQTGDFAGLQKFQKSDLFQEHMAKLDGINTALAKMSQYAKGVYALTNITPDEKRQQMDGIQYQMIQTAIMGNRISRDSDAAYAAMKGTK